MSKVQLLSKTKTELMKIAQRLGLRVISTLIKAELAGRIAQAQQQAGTATKQPMGVTAIARKVSDALKRRAIRKRDAVAIAGRAVKPIATKPITTRPARTVKPKTEDTIAGAAAVELSAHKFDVTPKPPPPKQIFRDEYLGELPDAYGTGRLFLTARDPHWLYAYWDLTWQQMADYRGQSSDGRLLLRVFEKHHPKPIQE